MKPKRGEVPQKEFPLSMFFLGSMWRKKRVGGHWRKSLRNPNHRAQQPQKPSHKPNDSERKQPTGVLEASFYLGELPYFTNLKIRWLRESSPQKPPFGVRSRWVVIIHPVFLAGTLSWCFLVTPKLERPPPWPSARPPARALAHRGLGFLERISRFQQGSETNFGSSKDTACPPGNVRVPVPRGGSASPHGWALGSSNKKRSGAPQWKAFPKRLPSTNKTGFPQKRTPKSSTQAGCAGFFMEWRSRSQQQSP